MLLAKGNAFSCALGPILSCFLKDTDPAIVPFLSCIKFSLWFTCPLILHQLQLYFSPSLYSKTRKHRLYSYLKITLFKVFIKSCGYFLVVILLGLPAASDVVADFSSGNTFSLGFQGTTFTWFSSSSSHFFCWFCLILYPLSKCSSAQGSVLGSLFFLHLFPDFHGQWPPLNYLQPEGHTPTAYLKFPFGYLMGI